VLAWLIRLGFLADLLSRPVLIGYLTGIAVIMVAGQLGRMTGSSVTGDSPLAEVVFAVRHADSWHPLTVGLSAAVLILLLASARWVPRLPGPLLVMVLAAGLW
jgi:MFS superfamily sulfate permease-like transporter